MKAIYRATRIASNFVLIFMNEIKLWSEVAKASDVKVGISYLDRKDYVLSHCARREATQGFHVDAQALSQGECSIRLGRRQQGWQLR